MILRPRQAEFVDASMAALLKHGNTLGVAPTGAGKTVMLSAIAGDERFGSSIILQHRDELVEQNRATFRAVNPKVKTDLFTASRKKFLPSGATFAMMQTIVGHLKDVPRFDLCVIDETHRVGAASYIKILKALRDKNPDIKIFGVTATPERADGKALGHVFDNVSDVISLAELVATGHLVRPRTFVIDLDIREALEGAQRAGSEYDMSQVDRIMNTSPINHEVVKKWKQTAGDRHTVVFCSTVKHAKDLKEEFDYQGISAEIVHGEMPKPERRDNLKRFDKRQFQVLINVAVLTEGWDCQHVDCVMLCRPCSFRSTVIQMLGRGLRQVDANRYPYVKDDCIILDFGCSLLTYPDIFQLNEVSMIGESEVCPKCMTKLPKKVRECPICGYQFPYEAPEEEERSENGSAPDETEELKSFQMSEIQLCDVSPFRWVNLHEGLAMVASGMTAEAFLLRRNGIWHAVGKAEKQAAVRLYKSNDKVAALSAANDFMCIHGSRDAKKTKRWLNEGPTARQCELLGLAYPSFSLNKYTAACMLGFKFNQNALKLLTENS